MRPWTGRIRTLPGSRSAGSRTSGNANLPTPNTPRRTRCPYTAISPRRTRCHEQTGYLRVSVSHFIGRPRTKCCSPDKTSRRCCSFCRRDGTDIRWAGRTLSPTSRERTTFCTRTRDNKRPVSTEGDRACSVKINVHANCVSFPDLFR